MKIVITEKQSKLIKLILKESSELLKLSSSIQNAIKQVEQNYGVKITDENIKKELEQEGQTYPDNGKIENTAFQKLKEFLDELYKKFPNAPKPKNSNCNNLAGCQSGYRGYSTQASVFGSKIREQGGVSGRQRASALPGFSQHSTGKTFDILDLRPDWWNSNKNIKDWVADNCGRFGFKISYERDGVLRMAEPWHLYYTGNVSSSNEKSTDSNTNEKSTDSNTNTDTLKTFMDNFIKFVDKKIIVDKKSSKNDITRMQIVLFIVTKNQKIKTDGIFTDETKKEIEDFQNNNDLTKTGYFDLETQKKLAELIKSPTQTQNKSSETKILVSNLDVSKLDSNNLISPSSKRGQTYGWRGAIPSLCSKSRSRYCNWHWHAGRDYGGLKVGTPIVLLIEGKMIKNGYPSGYCFELSHSDGSRTKWCHCQSVYFKTGDIIKPGSVLATVGNKGPSTGPHLHFEYFPPNAQERKETKGNVTKMVKDTDPKNIDEKIFTFIKPDKLSAYETNIKKI